MNKDIAIMIQLQQFWDSILESQNEIQRKNKTIQFWRDEVADLENSIHELDQSIKKLKTSIKTGDLKLSEVEQRLSLLGVRRDNGY